jgi:hypothetical protein
MTFPLRLRTGRIVGEVRSDTVSPRAPGRRPNRAAKTGSKSIGYAFEIPSWIRALDLDPRMLMMAAIRLARRLKAKPSNGPS